MTRPTVAKPFRFISCGLSCSNLCISELLTNMYFVEDENFARQLQNEYQAYENFKKEKENSNPVDSKLEYTDPTPSIHDLFMNFNRKFFWNSLGMVEVVWSNRMTTCAGLCSFEGGRGLCKIALSAPLLSLRPRKDLVETLLHEMIHAYLFVTHNFKDRDDHGPEFHKHMYRINKQAGTNITVYHTFYNEVEYYQRHIWRCDGPCQKKKPYFGFVRRAMNRPPGPSDNWWNDHKRDCGGTFTKISGPEKKPKNTRKVVIVKPGDKHKDIRNYFTQKGSSQTNIENQNKSNIKTLADIKSRPSCGVKTNTGTGTLVITKPKKENTQVKNPVKSSVKTNSKNKEKSKIPEPDQTKPGLEKSSEKNSKDKEKIKISEPKQTKSTQSKETAETTKDSHSRDIRDLVRSKWANKFTNTKPPDKQSPKKIKLDCPVCGNGFSEEEIENHVDECLKTVSNREESQGETSNSEKIDEYKMCPVCSGKILKSEMNGHLESCLKCKFVNEGDEGEIENEILCESVPCPCCYKWFPESEMNSHIDDCLTLNTLKQEILAS